MRMKYLALAASVLLVAACQTAPDDASGMAGGGQAGAGGAGSLVPGSAQAAMAELEQNVGDRVFFGFDRYDLSAEARATLDRQAEWMRRYPQITITVEGHADERGTREYNLALGERRANSMKNYLVALGVDENRVATISYGKERPAVTGSNEASWAQNRRGVTVVN